MKTLLANDALLTPLLHGAPLIAGVGSALPSLRVSQREVLDFILDRFGVGEAAKVLYRRTLGNASIETRHFALSSLEEALDIDPDRVVERFQREGTALSARALRRALEQAHLPPTAVDFLAVSTCTGYLCPGLSAYVLESAGLRRDARVADLVGMGCGAAIPALEQASNFVRANPGAVAAVVATEICSATLFSNDEPDIIVSNSIFADGSAAVVLRSPVSANGSSARPRLAAFSSTTRPDWRETLRFRHEGGRLRNVLGRDVPDQAAEAVEAASAELLSRHGLAPEDVRRWILHAGGPKVVDALERRLNLPDGGAASSRAVLRTNGNMSSPTVLFVLEKELEQPAEPGEVGVMASFGAGFSAHTALVVF